MGRGEGREGVLCTFSSPPEHVWPCRSLAGEHCVLGTLRSHPDPLCLARGLAAADIACDLDFLSRSNQCLDGSTDVFCGLGIVKAVCPRDATHWSMSVRSQGREGRECSPFADFPIPFLCLSGKRWCRRCRPHAGHPSPARCGPSSPRQEAWSAAGALGMAARTLLAAAQRRCVSPVRVKCLPSVRAQAAKHSVAAGSRLGWSHLLPRAVPFTSGRSGHAASAGGEDVSRKAAACGWHLHGSRCWGGACPAHRYFSLGHVALGWAARSWSWSRALWRCPSGQQSPGGCGTPGGLWLCWPDKGICHVPAAAPGLTAPSPRLLPCPRAAAAARSQREEEEEDLNTTEADKKKER